MLTQTDPTFANWDQDETALDDAYETQDPAVGRGRAACGGDRHRRPVRRASPATSGRGAGIRSDGAHFTVESFARYVVHDVTHHLVDV